MNNWVLQTLEDDYTAVLNEKGSYRVSFTNVKTNQYINVDIYSDPRYHFQQSSYEVDIADGGGGLNIYATITGVPYMNVKAVLSTMDIPNSFAKYVNMDGGIKVNIYNQTDTDFSRPIDSFTYPLKIRIMVDRTRLEIVKILLRSYDLYDIFKVLPKDICEIIEDMRISDIIQQFNKCALTFPHTEVLISNLPTAGSDRLKRILSTDVNTPFSVSAKLFCRSEEETYDTDKTIRTILTKKYRNKVQRI